MKETKESIFNKIAFPIKTDMNVFKSFLSEIFFNVTKRAKREMDLFLFNEVIGLPLFVSEKIIKVLTNNALFMSKQVFSDGLSILYYGRKKEIIELLFQILDFNIIQKINYDDTKLFFTYLHSIYHSSRSIKMLYEVLDAFFDRETKIDLSDFMWKCNNQNYDLIMLFSFLIHNAKFFSNAQIDYYYSEIRKESNSDKKDIDEESSANLHISKKLIEYCSLPITPQSHPSSNKDISVIEEEDDKELSELQNFESELADTMSNMDRFGTRSKKENNDDDEDEDEYANLGVRKTGTYTKEKLSSFFKSKEAKQRAFSFFGSEPKKFKSFYETCPKNELGFKLKPNEIVVYSINHNNSLLLVKLVLISNMIFLFTYNTEYFKFTFLKIIFLGSTYATVKSKTQIDDKMFYGFHLISTYHNTKSTISFFNEDEEKLLNFKSLLDANLNVRNVDDDYVITSEVGRGKFGVVKIARAKKNDKKYAVKIINKFDKSTTEEDYKIFQWEKSIFLFLKQNPHPNIVKAIDLYENEEYIYFISELIQGGDLKTFVKNGKMDSQNLVSFSFQIINGIFFLHNNGIMHRDIKHTNVLVSRAKNGDNIIKIIDFGLSRVIGKNEMDNSPYGSLSFKAPEIIKGENYNFKVDVWSAGITIFFITFHDVPFNDKNRQKLKEKIVSENFTFPSFKERLRGNYDYSFVYQLITDCLVKDMNVRLDSRKLMKKYFENFGTSFE